VWRVPAHLPGACDPAGRGTLQVLDSLCTGCAECLEVCPVGVISLAEWDHAISAHDET